MKPMSLFHSLFCNRHEMQSCSKAVTGRRCHLCSSCHTNAALHWHCTLPSPPGCKAAGTRISKDASMAGLNVLTADAMQRCPLVRHVIYAGNRHGVQSCSKAAKDSGLSPWLLLSHQCSPVSRHCTLHFALSCKASGAPVPMDAGKAVSPSP